MYKSMPTKEELAKRCVAEGLIPFCGHSEQSHFYRDDSSEIEEALGIQFRTFTNERLSQVDKDIMLYERTPDTKFQISNGHIVIGDGSGVYVRDIEMTAEELSIVGDEVFIVGVVDHDWAYRDAERIMYSTIDFNREYTLELEKARQMDEAERKLWAEKLATRNKPVYQFDVVQMFEAVGGRHNAWPFSSLQAGDTISLTLQARRMDDPEHVAQKFSDLKIESAILMESGQFGNMWLFETADAVFVSYDIEKELQAELQRRQELLPMAAVLAERYASEPHGYGRSVLEFISRSTLQITTQDKESPRPVSLTDIKPGDKLTIHPIHTNNHGYDQSAEYDRLERDQQFPDDIVVQQVWTDGTDIVLECDHNFVYSTIDFMNEYAARSAELHFDRMPIDQKIAEIGAYREAPTLLVESFGVIDQTTGKEIPLDQLKAGMSVTISGQQTGDMRFENWNSSMRITADITIENVFVDGDSIAIVAKDGPILTNVDCRQQFVQKLQEIAACERREYMESLDMHPANVTMDDSFGYDRPERGEEY